MESAYEWGARQIPPSCALAERAEFDRLHPGEGQTGFYKACSRGDWLLWQLERCKKMTPDLHAVMQRAVDVIVDRAVRNYALEQPCTAAWAAKWLSGKDRSARAARAARAAGVAELKQQADDIRAEIPEWPGD